MPPPPFNDPPRLAKSALGRRIRGPMLTCSLISLVVLPSQAGLTSADFLTFPIGPRSIAMGETGAAFAEDAGALFWNPGSLDFLPQSSLVMGRAPYLDAVQDHAAFSRSFGKTGSAALGISVLSYDSLESLDAEGSVTGSLTPREWQTVAGFGRRFRGPRWLAGHGWGVAGKWVSSNLDGTAQTVAVDAGFLSRPAERWRWGMSFSNLGPGLEREETTESLPRCVRVGAVWTPGRSWTAAGETRWRSGSDPVLGLGVEYGTPLTSQAVVFARAGYTTEEFREDPLNGLRMGFGMGWKNVRLDYSFRFIQESAAAHALALSLRMDARGKTLPPALQALVDQGNRQIERNQFPEAVLTFEEALTLSPDCPPAWEGLEKARLGMGAR